MRAWAGFVALAWIAGCGGAADPPDGGAPDASGIDAARTLDGGSDAAAIDARVDTGLDAGTDAGLDAGTDAFARDAPRADTDVDAGRACPTGGGCTLPSGGVGACCGGVCVDAASDDTNCDRCGLRCRVGMSCVQGACAYRACAGAFSAADRVASWAARCVLADGTPQGICCGDACHALSDFAADAANCGACDYACPTGQTCAASRCGPGPVCTSTSPPCAPDRTCWQRTACLRSTCVGQPDDSPCPLSPSVHLGACCAGACVDPITSPANCGACGHTCSAGTACEYGACSPLASCDEPGTDHADCVLASGGIGRCCGQSCVDLTSDSANCGNCSIACSGGASCTRVGPSTIDGACVVPTDGGISVTHCTSSADCPSGTQCDVSGGICEREDCAGIADGAACRSFSFDGMCCGGACVDVTRDPNCGGCGVACASGVCVVISSAPFAPAVTCLPALTPSPDCSSAGGCTAEEACVGDVCVARSCASGSPFQMYQDRRYSLCLATSGAAGICVDDASFSALVCIDSANDPMHCGGNRGSGGPCAPGERCVRGRCVP